METLRGFEDLQASYQLLIESAIYRDIYKESMEDQQIQEGGSDTQHIVLKRLKHLQPLKGSSNKSKQSDKPRNYLKGNFHVLAVVFLFVLVSGLIYLLYQPTPNRTSNAFQLLEGSNSSDFPKILWMVYDQEFEGLGMVNSLIAKHQKQIALNSGFEVRIVNPVDAYDWLSPATTEMIRKAKHNSLFGIEVAELLRIALLVEHGGISFGPNNRLFLVQNLKWIEQVFNYDKDTQERLISEGVLNCSGGSHPQALLFEHHGGLKSEIDDDVFIAKPNATIFREIFEEMIEILIKGQPSDGYLKNIGDYNSNHNAIYMNGLSRKLLTLYRSFSKNSFDFCSHNAVIIINRSEGSFIRYEQQASKGQKSFVVSRNHYLYEKGQTKMIRANFEKLTEQLKSVLFKETINTHKDSFFSELIRAEENVWLLTPINHKRNASFCIISLKPLSLEDYFKRAEESVKRLLKQSFTNWKAVFFVNKLSSKVQIVSERPKVFAVNASKWQGLNLQRAATLHCDSKDIAILLDYDQLFQNQDALLKLSTKFSDNQVYGGFVSTKVGSSITKPHVGMNFYRHPFRIDANNFKDLAFHLRAFSLNAYRMVPSFDLHSPDGRYFNRQLPLYTMAQLASSECNELDAAYLLKDVQRKMEIPKKRVYLQDVVIKMPAVKNLTLKEAEYKSKFNVKNWCYGINQYHKYVRSSLNNYFVLNNGQQFKEAAARKDMPQLIPKKIHQIWVGERELPAFKKIFMEKIRNLHPKYEYRLWGNDDITRENFPQTYDIIQTLFRIDKTSPVRKLASIADFMRMEIIYRHGGFYLDTNYYIFKNHTFDDWLTYKAVWPGQLIPHYKQERENGFFGAVPGFQNLGKLLDHRLLSTRSLVQKMANYATGPFYLSLAIQGDDELDQQILVLPQDYIYPQYGGKQECLAKPNTPPDKLLFKNRNAYRKDCEDIYHWAFGIDFMAQGSSWRSK